MRMAHPQHAVLFDLDGTLIDSVYQHVRIWSDLLREHGMRVPTWKVHRGIGLPSECLLAWLLKEQPHTEAELIAQHDKRFLQCAGDLGPTDGAIALLNDLEHRQVPFQVVTSAGEETRAALFKALGRKLPMPKSTGHKTGKPSAEPILVALQTLGLEPGQATMIGDAIWDGEAARRAGTHFIGLRCGGTSDARLQQAGALWIEDSPRDLIGRL
jgi:HAD superfamily hydrolase (TIGR01509 family)